MMGYRVMFNRSHCGSDAGACATNADAADYAERLAHWAKMELLKEKVKAKLDARYGKKLDALADTVVDVLVDKLDAQENEEARRDDLEAQWDGVFYEGNGKSDAFAPDQTDAESDE